VACVVTVVMIRSCKIPVDATRSYFMKILIVLCLIGCVGRVSGLCCQRCHDASRHDTGRRK